MNVNEVMAIIEENYQENKKFLRKAFLDAEKKGNKKS